MSFKNADMCKFVRCRIVAGCVCTHPAFIVVMGKGVLIPFFCNASNIKLLSMIEYKLDNIILLNGVMILCIGISISLTLINGCSVIMLL